MNFAIRTGNNESGDTLWQIGGGIMCDCDAAIEIKKLKTGLRFRNRTEACDFCIKYFHPGCNVHPVFHAPRFVEAYRIADVD